MEPALKSFDLLKMREVPRKIDSMLPSGVSVDFLRYGYDVTEEDPMVDYSLLIKKTFEKVFPLLDKASFFFFESLFEYDPYLSSHFTCSAREQAQKFYDVLRFSADHFCRLNGLITGLEDMIQQHWVHDVTHKDFEAIGDAWLMTLHRVLGKEFSDETREAWIFYLEFLQSKICAV